MHAYGIVQGRLVHAYATPMIFNWVLGSLPVSIQQEMNIDIMVSSHSDANL